MSEERIGASFRDPSGFLFSRDGTLYRQVNLQYRRDYDHLMDSGLYDELLDRGLLIPHEEVAIDPLDTNQAYKVIQPERINFISYPYEWSFSQLRDAAFATLNILGLAIKHRMVLKDASAYNVQFYHGRPLLIDTLSFEHLREGEPWDAYRQFCQHFLAPLCLMSYKDIRLSQLLRVFIDGVPLDLASRLLPGKTYLQPSILTHIHIHAKMQKRSAAVEIDQIGMRRRTMSHNARLGLIDSLKRGIQRLQWKSTETPWGDYYSTFSYSDRSIKHKEELVIEFLEECNPSTVWDFGANVGRFSRLASGKNITTVAFDVDAGAVEQNYLKTIEDGDKHLMPLILDLTNPSSSLGWASKERLSLVERGPADAVFALALVHHLAIGNNLPLIDIADFFSKIGTWLLVEYVPKQDPQVQRMLTSRRDIFTDYTQEGFEKAFKRFFIILSAQTIEDSARRIYVMKRLEGG